MSVDTGDNPQSQPFLYDNYNFYLMKPLHACAVIAMLLALTICPSVLAATTSTTTVADWDGNMPYNIYLLFVVIGFGTLILMKYNQEIEVLLGCCSTLAFGIVMWYSAYISNTDVFAMVAADGSMDIAYSNIVTPQPVLQVFFGVCFLFAMIYTIYVMFLRKADSELDKKSVPRG